MAGGARPGEGNYTFIFENEIKRIRELREDLLGKGRQRDFYTFMADFRKGQNIGTLKKREQGSMLLSSNYRRNSTYVANIG